MDRQMNGWKKWHIEVGAPPKNQLFEVTKEFQDFKFQQNLKVELEKDEIVFQETIFVDPWFDSYKEVFDDTNIDELLDKKTMPCSKLKPCSFL